VKKVRRLLNKKGLSLVEVLVVLLVSSILLIIVTGMIAPVNNLLSSVSANAHMDTMCNTINEYFRSIMQTASKAKVVGYDGVDVSTINAVAADYLTEAQSGVSGYKAEARAIVIRKNCNNQFRIYDMEKYSNASNISNFITSIAPDEEEPHRLFMDCFYENTSLKVSINCGSNIKISTQCLKNINGIEEVANQEKNLTFQTLGISVDNALDIKPAEGAANTDDCPNGIVLFYIVPNFKQKKS